jgi:hypothetical protein
MTGYCPVCVRPYPDCKCARWVGLTDEEKQEWIDAMPYDIEPRHCVILANIMEAKLKEKNTCRP